MAIQRIGPGFNFDKSKQAFETFKTKAPQVLANDSLNHFSEGFRMNGGKTEASKTGWEPRKQNAKRNSGRGILIDTGALRRSLKVISATWKNIVIGSVGTAYAERHNEGLSGMPKREFIGDSNELNEKNKKTLVRLLTSVFR